jgi:hypothetical protein
MTGWVAGTRSCQQRQRTYPGSCGDPAGVGWVLWRSIASPYTWRPVVGEPAVLGEVDERVAELLVAREPEGHRHVLTRLASRGATPARQASDSGVGTARTSPISASSAAPGPGGAGRPEDRPVGGGPPPERCCGQHSVISPLAAAA